MKKLGTLCLLLLGLHVGVKAQVQDAVWQPLSGGLKYQPTAMGLYNNNVVVAYQIADYNAKGRLFGISVWTGNVWNPLRHFLLDSGGTIHALRTYKSELYIAGHFTRFGPLTNVGNLVKWTGKEYKNVQNMSANTSIKTDGIEHLNEYKSLLVVAGRFPNTQVTSGQNLGFFNGEKWVSPDIKELENVNGGVLTTIDYDGDFYIGGLFTKIGTTRSRYLARFEGGELAPFEGNIIRPYKMVVANEKLYASGALSSTTKPSFFVKIHGDSTYKINNGFSDVNEITDMVSDGKVIYASGVFNFPGVASKVYLAKYENEEWKPMPGGLLPDVRHLMYYRENIIAAGEFKSYNDVPLGYVARVAKTFSLSVLQGTIFFDKNENCRRDDIEENFLNRVVRIMPGNVLVRPNREGFFNAFLKEGKYEVSVIAGDYWRASPCSALSQSVDLETGKRTNVNFALVQKSNIKDLAIKIVASTGTIATRTNTQQYYLNYENLGSSELVSGVVSLKYDSDLNSMIAFPPPSQRFKDSAIWRISNLSPGEDGMIKCQFKIDPDAVKDIELTASISQPAVEEDDENNSSSLTQQLVEENTEIHKSVSPGENWSDTAYIDPDADYVRYMISFANYTDDTVKAVYVIDTVRLNASIKSINDVSFSHNVVDASYPGPAFSNYYVLVYKFEDINLPPNPTRNGEIVNDEGHAAFELALKDNLVEGQQFVNTATVVFDYQFDKLTNTVFAIVDEENVSVTPVSLPNVEAKLYPNPTSGKIWIESTEDVSFDRYNVISVTGSTVLSSELARDQQYIEMSDLSSGMYIVELAGKTGVHRARIMKD